MNDELVVIEQEERDGRLVVRVLGEIDLSNVDLLQRRLERVVEGSQAVVVDLAGVEYIDSQGLRLLNRLASRIGDAGATLQVVAPEGSIVRNVLELTHMSDDLDLRDGVDG
jgi:anti-anti-sigma factor